MDAALLLVAGNETCPQPQTSEHLAAVEIMRLQNIIILQNKVGDGYDTNESAWIMMRTAVAFSFFFC